MYSPGCETYTWSAWSDCNIACGAGTTRRRYAIFKDPSGCASKQETQVCGNCSCEFNQSELRILSLQHKIDKILSYYTSTFKSVKRNDSLILNILIPPSSKGLKRMLNMALEFDQ